MKKRRLAGYLKYQNKNLPVTMKMWMQFSVMPRTVISKNISAESNNEQ